MKNDYLHRDDIPFEWIEKAEEALGAKILFPGDRELDEESEARIQRHKEWGDKIYREGRCRSCRKVIPGFTPEIFKGVTFENNNWPADSEFFPSFSLTSGLNEPSGIMCRECLYSKPGLKVRYYDED